MRYQYDASAPISGKEKKVFDLISSQGSNRIDRLVERGVGIDFTNAESNGFYDIIGQLKTKRTHLFSDPKQVIFRLIKA